MAESDLTEFRLQPKQEEFCSCSADICFYGGSAGGGKTYGSLFESIRNVHVPGFTCAIFRRTMADVKRPGSLWDDSADLYPYMGAKPNLSEMYWRFPAGPRIQFAGLERENDKFNWMGSALCLIIFEEVTHFTESQFWYLLSRNRSTCGVKPYIRATCNPDSDSWVRELIDWWIGPDGYVIDERSGVIRYFTRLNNKIIWADTPEELIALIPELERHDIKSFTFIRSRITDNQALLSINPEYLGNLKALGMVERKRLLDGNWDIRPSAGMYFRREWFNEIDEIELPDDIDWMRSWDFAATTIEENKDADLTAGVKMGKSRSTGSYYVADCKAFMASPMKVRQEVLRTAESDGRACRITIPKDPGQAGKAQAFDMISMLAGYSAQWIARTGSKITYASPYSAQVEAGNVFVVRGAWNADYYKVLENFPEAVHEDEVDASADAFNKLSRSRREMLIAS